MTTFDERVPSTGRDDDGFDGADEQESPSASMTLGEHLGELRGRLFKSAVAIGIGMVIGWFLFDPIYAFLSAPINGVIAEAQAQGRNIQVVVLGVTDPFTLKLKLSAMFGLMLSAPVWLYQLWRFVTPGLRRNERRYAYAFVGFGFPLFLAGVAVAYLVLPKGLDLLFGFTPENVSNYVEVTRYLSFFLGTALVFGIGFLLPLFVVALNLVGILSFQRLVSWWRGIVFGIFVFAAVATPSGDPITLFTLVIPMMLLIGAAAVFCWVNDRRRSLRAGAEPDYEKFDDDEASPLPESDNG